MSDYQPAISVDQFGLKYGLGRTTIYKLINEGHLTARKVGSRTIILPDDERAWLDSLPLLETHRAGGE